MRGVLLLVLALLASRGLAAAGPGEAFVVSSTAAGPCPQGELCVTLEQGLADQSLSHLILLEDVQVPPPNRRQPTLLARDVLLTSQLGQELHVIDFAFQQDGVLIGPNTTLTLEGVVVKNLRKGSGLGVDYFSGLEGSALVFRDVARWRHVCIGPSDAMAAGMSYPRPPQLPGNNTITVQDVCVQGKCYNNSLVYPDFALHVSIDSSESNQYIPGYTLRLINSSRLCGSYISPACTAVKPLETCQIEATEAWLASLAGAGNRGDVNPAVAAGVGTAVGAAVLAGAIGAGAWAMQRRRRRAAEGDDVESGTFGPLTDMVLTNHKSGWRIAAQHSTANNTTGSGGTAAAAVLPPEDRIQLGVLLGAGSFGRVYRAQWRGRVVAVKVMTHDIHAAARVANEVELTMSFSHPNIVQAFDVITWTRSPRQFGSVGGTNNGTGPSHAVTTGSRGSGSHPSSQLASLPSKPHVPGPVCAAAGDKATASALGDDSAEAVGGQTPPARALPAAGIGAPEGDSSASAAAVTAAAAATAGAQGGKQGRLPLPDDHGFIYDLESGQATGGGASRPTRLLVKSDSGKSQQQQQQQGAGVPLEEAHPCSGDSDVNNPQPGAVLNYVPVGPAGLGTAGCANTATTATPLPGPLIALVRLDGQQQQQQPAPPPVSSSGNNSGSLPRPPGSGPLPSLTSGAATCGGAAWPPSLLGNGGSGGLTGEGPAASEVGEAQTWLITQYCDGGTLADAVGQGRFLGEDGTPHMATVLLRLREVAAGMSYLHSRSVLHGDLKAANVLLASCPAAPFEFTAKISDFGLSRVLSAGATHRSTRTLGTVTHTPPELLRSGKMSAAGDVYSFGILMWELYTGRPAFESLHYGEVFERVVLHDDRPPLPPGLPEPYALLMTSCWRADPSERPSFDSVLQCLELMLEERGCTLDGCPCGGNGGGGDGGAPAAARPAAASARSSGDGGGSARATAGEAAGGQALAGSAYVHDLF